jgi:hypothetical protein
MKQFECLGKTPGFVRYSGYDTEEEEAEFLPVWCDGDPIPAEDLAPTVCHTSLHIDRGTPVFASKSTGRDQARCVGMKNIFSCSEKISVP